MPEDKKYRLRRLEIDRVDMVDRGANQHSAIVIAKAAPPIAKPAAPAPVAPAPAAAGAKPGSRLQRFTPDQFEMTLDTPTHREWSMKQEFLPEGFEDVSITMFSEGENQRWQWMMDPLDGPPVTGDAKSAAEAITSLRSNATNLVAGAQAGLVLPKMGEPGVAQPGQMPGKAGGAGAKAPATATPPAPASPPKTAAPQDESLLDRLRARLEATSQSPAAGTPRSNVKPKSGKPGEMSATRKSADAHQEVTMDFDIDALAEQIPDEVLDYIEELETQLASVTKAATDTEDPIAKALSTLPPEVAEIVKSQQARLQETEAALRTEQIRKADAEWIAKAAAADGLIDNPAEFGPKMRAVAEMDPELAEAVLKALSVATERLAKGDLFTEKGHSLQVPGSAEETANAMATEMISKGLETSAAVARAKVWESNPDLYAQYLAERQVKS